MHTLKWHWNLQYRSGVHILQISHGMSIYFYCNNIWLKEAHKKIKELCQRQFKSYTVKTSQEGNMHHSALVSFRNCILNECYLWPPKDLKKSFKYKNHPITLYIHYTKNILNYTACILYMFQHQSKGSIAGNTTSRWSTCRQILLNSKHLTNTKPDIRHTFHSYSHQLYTDNLIHLGYSERPFLFIICEQRETLPPSLWHSNKSWPLRTEDEEP